MQSAEDSFSALLIVPIFNAFISENRYIAKSAVSNAALSKMDACKNI